MMFVDAHIHLYDEAYQQGLKNIVDTSVRDGVSSIFCSAEDYQSSLKTIHLARRYPRIIYSVIGLHPLKATTSLEDVEPLLELIIQQRDEIAAIGEIGLDRKYAAEEEEWSRQMRGLQAMIEAAEDEGLPVVIHSRKSVKDVLEILESYDLRGVLFHWFSGDSSTLQTVIDRGFYVSFTPVLTYSKRVRRLAENAPVDRILTETDGPVSFWGEFKGLLTVPSHVIRVAEVLAEIFHLSLEETKERVLLNTEDLFELRLRPKTERH